MPVEEEETVVLDGISLTNADIQMALDKLQAAHSDAIGAPKVRPMVHIGDKIITTRL